MTSTRFNIERLRAAQELEIFDALPPAIRAEINNCVSPPRASVVRDALLRGVAEQTIIETILKRSQSK